jgi:hypothetical protein
MEGVAASPQGVKEDEGDGGVRDGERGRSTRLTTHDLPSRHLPYTNTYPALRPGTCGKGEGFFGGRRDWGSRFALTPIYVGARVVDSSGSGDG